MSIFSLLGNREQSAVNGARNMPEILHNFSPLRAGVINYVMTFDDSDNIPGAYLTYGVLLTPEGIQLDNVPGPGSSGHVVDTVTPNGPSITQQNTDDSPLVIGQPVLVGFLNNSSSNPVIICPLPCQFNAGSQTSVQYPQKTSVFQNTKETIDKSGNKIININIGGLSGNYQIQINGTPLVYVNYDGANYEINLGNGNLPFHPTILGDLLVAWLNTHVHSGGTLSSGSTGAPAVSVSGVTTNIVKVQ